MTDSTAPTADPAAIVPAVAADRAPLLPRDLFAPDVESLREPPARRTRLDSVDILRGLVMVIMALDHTRDYFHNAAFQFDPTDLTRTNAPLFFTRWITHFCAPVFVFLAGTGAFLSLGRGKTKRELSWFLVTRGAWLILLEVTLVRLGWTFDVRYHFIWVQVIWVLGWSMIILAGLIHLPSWLLTAFGAVLVAGHNLLDRVRAADFGHFDLLWQFLHEQGAQHWGAPPPNGFTFMIAYPLVPWVGVMALGYSFGRLLQLPEARRRRTLFRLGLALTLAFIILRATNLYGDPQPWSAQSTPGFTLLSFINCQKYPPSLLYLLMTLGPAIMLLPLLERWTGAVARFFLTFGRVPLFYYLLHVPVIHVLVVACAVARYGPQVLQVDASQGPPPGWGYPLAVVYLVWLVTVLLLYPLCRRWARLKQRNRSAWLSYL
ncbi:MAG TPA: heparan-alpha-glucosaminide N-acetyltransferase domain-containing protein [Pyrinomonadaceae bacterium]|jgi:uncharacterized membrane protein